MAIKYEQARSLKFNIWLFIAVQILSILLAMFAAWNRVQDQFRDLILQDHFNTWLIAQAKVTFIPGAGLTQTAAADYLGRVALIPGIHSQFVSAHNLIFVWAPVGAFVTVAATWLIGHALAGYFRQTRGGK